MPNPLDPIWEAHIGARDGLRAVALSDTSDPTLFPPGNAFGGLASAALDSKIEDIRTELDDLTVLSLAARFEHLVKGHFGEQGPDLRTAHPGLLGITLEAQFEAQVNRTPVDRLLQLFDPALPTREIRQFRQIWEYRNWVAHGRDPARPPARTVDPATSYNVLTGILSHMNLV
jgi:hypothetical protein